MHLETNISNDGNEFEYAVYKNGIPNVDLASAHYNDVIMGTDGVSNHQPHDCLLNRLGMRKSKKTSKLRVTGLCEGNSPVTGKFPPTKGQ